MSVFHKKDGQDKHICTWRLYWSGIFVSSCSRLRDLTVTVSLEVGSRNKRRVGVRLANFKVAWECSLFRQASSPHFLSWFTYYFTIHIVSTGWYLLLINGTTPRSVWHGLPFNIYHAPNPSSTHAQLTPAESSLIRSHIDYQSSIFTGKQYCRNLEACADPASPTAYAGDKRLRSKYDHCIFQEPSNKMKVM